MRTGGQKTDRRELVESASWVVRIGNRGVLLSHSDHLDENSLSLTKRHETWFSPTEKIYSKKYAIRDTQDRTSERHLRRRYMTMTEKINCQYKTSLSRKVGKMAEPDHHQYDRTADRLMAEDNDEDDHDFEAKENECLQEEDNEQPEAGDSAEATKPVNHLIQLLESTRLMKQKMPLTTSQ
jgi:hypothetical protein